jgi:hypothetical protein
LHARGESGVQGRAAASSRADAVRQVADELGVALVPVHPGQTHELLAPFYFVEVPDRATAERAAKRFRQVNGVEAAWVRPPAELA